MAQELELSCAALEAEEFLFKGGALDAGAAPLCTALISLWGQLSTDCSGAGSWLGSLDRRRGILTVHSIIHVLHLRAVADATQAGGNRKGGQLKAVPAAVSSVWPRKALGSISPIPVCFSLLFL